MRHFLHTAALLLVTIAAHCAAHAACLINLALLR